MKKRIGLVMAAVMMLCAGFPQRAFGGYDRAGALAAEMVSGEQAGFGDGGSSQADVHFGSEGFRLDSVAANGFVSFTENQLIKFLKKYDPDGAYILDRQRKNGSQILFWFSPGSKMVSGGLEVAVHEETHGYSLQEYGWGSGERGEAIYIGNQKKIDVKETTVYRSREMARTIPARLRTDRYETYVGSPDANMASDVEGAYGLLNEFTAYYWGMHTVMALKPYFEKNAKSPRDWDMYLHAGSNDRMAYAEFRFYILEYLYYAKKHYPQVYSGIMNNKEFVRAFRIIDKKSAKQNKAFEKQVKKLVQRYKSQGIHAELRGDYVYLGHSGIGLRTSSYNRLMKEMKKQKYKPILKILEG